MNSLILKGRTDLKEGRPETTMSCRYENRDYGSDDDNKDNNSKDNDNNDSNNKDDNNKDQKQEKLFLSF